MNVDEYLQRIAYNGSREPNLKNLGAISLAHKIAVPYTSLNMFGGDRIVLDLETMYKKIVVNRSGAMCYELNWLFKWLLEQLGYTVHCGQGELFHPGWGCYTPPYSHMFPFIYVDGEYYFCDPGGPVVGPMKIQHMHPHVETHAMYRSRNIPGQDSFHFYIERHKKTVLDSKGQIIKKGPAPPGPLTGYCNEKCAKEESDHWSPLFRMTTKPTKLGDYNKCNDQYHDEKNGDFQTQILLHRYEPKRLIKTFGHDYVIKESIDPNTDKIVVEKVMESDEEIVNVCKELYKYEVRHRVNFFSEMKKRTGHTQNFST